MSPALAFIVGFIGAFAVDFLPIHSLRYTPRSKWPEWVSLRSFWLLSAVGFLFGGGFAAAYAASNDIAWYVALNVGAAWPSIINAAARAGKIGPDQNSVS